MDVQQFGKTGTDSGNLGTRKTYQKATLYTTNPLSYATAGQASNHGYQDTTNLQRREQKGYCSIVTDGYAEHAMTLLANTDV
jgi:hypothetical protein